MYKVNDIARIISERYSSYITPSCIRKYEKILKLKIKRNISGWRMYSESDLEKIKTLYLTRFMKRSGLNNFSGIINIQNDMKGIN